jgi:hypothetical protein
MILTPIDTLNTTLQAQGAKGTAILRQRIKQHGIESLWWGAFATAAATFVGHYPWFATVRLPSAPSICCVLTMSKYNFLTDVIDEPSRDHHLFAWLLRLAFIGFIASVVSDSVSNSLRVVKTYRQVDSTEVSYCENTNSPALRPALTFPADAARRVATEDGLSGLLGRGLKTRILCNGLQGLLFSILWKLFLDLWFD